MLEPDDSPIEEQLLAFVRSWFDLLAAGQIADACRWLDEPNSYGIVWTPLEISNLVADTFGPETRFGVQHPEGPVFTAPAQTEGNGRFEVYHLEDGSGFSADHDVPLNGTWSDLTAQFEFKWRGHRLAVILHDLHVM